LPSGIVMVISNDNQWCMVQETKVAKDKNIYMPSDTIRTDETGLESASATSHGRTFKSGIVLGR